MRTENMHKQNRAIINLIKCSLCAQHFKKLN